MEDSESNNSLSEDSEADLRDTDFHSGMFSHTASSNTTPESKFPSHIALALSNTSGTTFPSHTASGFNTPALQVPPHTFSPTATSQQQDTPFPESRFTTSLQSLQPNTDFFSRTPAGTFFENPNNNNNTNSPLSLDNHQTSNFTTPWELPPYLSSSLMQQKTEDAMTGVLQDEQQRKQGKQGTQAEKHGSTLILEDVQPQMVTSIINLLFESKSIVKMKIVSQE